MLIAQVAVHKCKFSKSNQNFITGDTVKLLSESVETKDSKAMVDLLCKLIISSWLCINVLSNSNFLARYSSSFCCFTFSHSKKSSCTLELPSLPNLKKKNRKFPTIIKLFTEEFYVVKISAHYNLKCNSFCNLKKLLYHCPSWVPIKTGFQHIYYPSIICIIELSKRSRFSKYCLAKWQ